MENSNSNPLVTTTQSGFSLVELMMVVTIIGLLASFFSDISRVALIAAKRAEAKGQVRVLQIAVESYLAANSAFPGKLDIVKWFEIVPMIDETTGCPVQNFVGYTGACSKFYTMKLIYQPGGISYTIETDNRANQICPSAYSDIQLVYGNTLKVDGWYGTGEDKFGKACWERDAIIDGCKTSFFLNGCDFPFAGDTLSKIP